MPGVVGLILATGRLPGRSQPLALERHEGAPLLAGLLTRAEAWPVDRILIVIGDDHDEVLATVDTSDVLVVVDPEWSEGVAASIRVALDTIVREHLGDHVVIADIRTPALSADVVTELVAAALRGTSHAVVPKYRYTRGTPIVIHRALWPRLLGMEGTATVDQLLQTHPEWVEEIWFDRLPPRRIESPFDLD